MSKKASAWLSHFGIESAGELPNSIDADDFLSQASERDFKRELGIPDDALLVSFAGRLVPEKGAVELAQAVAAIAERPGTGERPVHAVIAGAGPKQGDIERIGCAQVHLAGRLERQDLAALLTQSDAMALPSRSEGFATTLLEAAACATPSIVTPVGGTDELVSDERFGTIIPDMSANSVEVALREAARNPQRLTDQGKNVADRVRSEFSWKRTATRALVACAEANGK